MRVERLRVDDAVAAAARLRGLVAPAASVRAEVAKIVESVRQDGDRALTELAQRLDGVASGTPLRVAPEDTDRAIAALRPDLRAGLETAMANVAAVAGTGLGDDAELTLPQGQRIHVHELAVSRAGIYVPGGRAPYVSTVVMGAVTARVAGVEEIVVCAPGAHPLILAACELCGVDEIYRVGGAQAVAALAYGTQSIARVDVVAGPGSLWVQEAKRLVSGDVGIDGFLGPSDVLVIAGADADPRLIALDLLAQAEHGQDTVVVGVSDDEDLLERVASALETLEGQPGGATPGVGALVLVADLDAALALAEAFAPEHLELHGSRAERLAPAVRSAGCVFVGAAGATAFGDYVAGSNHSLPTGGSARFASALSVGHFRRRMAEVHLGEAAPALCRAGVPIARAEGFERHAASMRARVSDVGHNPSR